MVFSDYFTLLYRQVTTIKVNVELIWDIKMMSDISVNVYFCVQWFA